MDFQAASCGIRHLNLTSEELKEAAKLKKAHEKRLQEEKTQRKAPRPPRKPRKKRPLAVNGNGLVPELAKYTKRMQNEAVRQERNANHNTEHQPAAIK